MVVAIWVIHNLLIWKYFNKSMESVEILSFLEKYHRWILWTVLGILFICDIITTTIGLQNGGTEQNQAMKPFVSDILQHSIIKILALVLSFVLIESLIKFSEKMVEKDNSRFTDFVYMVFYGIIIIGLLSAVIFYLMTVLRNLRIISWSENHFFLKKLKIHPVFPKR